MASKSFVWDVPSQTLAPMMRKLSYWAKFDAEDRDAILGLPHRTERIERHRYVMRE